MSFPSESAPRVPALENALPVGEHIKKMPSPSESSSIWDVDELAEILGLEPGAFVLNEHGGIDIIVVPAGSASSSTSLRSSKAGSLSEPDHFHEVVSF
jgi:hypothetical protein